MKKTSLRIEALSNALENIKEEVTNIKRDIVLLKSHGTKGRFKVEDTRARG
jgi:hypothetical protein